MFVAINYDWSFDRAAWHDEAMHRGDGLRKVQVLRNALLRAAGANSVPMLLGPLVSNMDLGCSLVSDQSVLVVSEESHDWQSLVPAKNNRLWALEPAILQMIAAGCNHWLEQSTRSENKRTTTKMRWLVKIVQNVWQIKSFPNTLLRRLDFAPLEECLCQLPRSQLDFLTRDEGTPPVQLWAGRSDAVETFNSEELVSLFCRALKDQCWATMRTTSVMASHRALISRDADLLYLMEPPDTARPSLYKGCLVWVALSSAVRAVLMENSAPELAFHRYFATGQLHLVVSSDVTNSKLKLTPRVTLPETDVDAAPWGPAEPEPENPTLPFVPGATMIHGREVAGLHLFATHKEQRYKKTSFPQSVLFLP